ncbi:MAG: hypothetical protein OXI71_06940, partial [Gemmatimonadota bacterium]|nr:hypothetical protein [Gemmatimonadota bacterium]
MFPGMILWGVRTMAPAVPPGMYTVRRTVGAATETAQVAVKPHLWVTDVAVVPVPVSWTSGRPKHQAALRLNFSRARAGVMYPC